MGQMGINLQPVDVIYPCIEGWEGTELASSPQYACCNGCLGPFTGGIVRLSVVLSVHIAPIRALRRKVLPAVSRWQNDPLVRPSHQVVVVVEFVCALTGPAVLWNVGVPFWCSFPGKLRAERAMRNKTSTSKKRTPHSKSGVTRLWLHPTL